LLQFDDAGGQLLPAVEQLGDCVILDARDVTELVSLPIDTHGFVIVRVIPFAEEVKCLARVQPVPNFLAMMVLESGDGRCLNQNRSRWCPRRGNRNAPEQARKLQKQLNKLAAQHHLLPWNVNQLPGSSRQIYRV